MSDMEISNGQKANLVWRAAIFLMGAFTLAIGARINTGVEETQNEIGQQSRDIALIKYELPNIKAAAINDKQELTKQIDLLEKRIQSMRDSGDVRQEQISKLITAVELIKQKLAFHPQS